MKSIGITLFTYKFKSKDIKIVLPITVNKLYSLLFILILLSGGIFRFYNINWDSGHVMHPDERKMTIMVATVDFPKNFEPPYQTYNGFCVYLFRSGVEIVSKIKGDESIQTDWKTITVIDRTITAFISTISIIIFFLLSRKIFSKKLSLFAISIFAFSPTLIQHAHFAVTETFLVFFLLLICLESFEILKNYKNFKHWLFLALFTGMSIATKTSAVSFLLIPAVSIVITLYKHRKSDIIYLGIFLLLSIFSFFFIFSPYSLINFDDFLSSMKFEQSVVAGTTDVPWTIQFIDTKPFIFYIYNLLWQISPIVIVIGIVGLLSKLILTLKRRDDERSFILILFTFVYFVYVGCWFGKYNRYMLPIVPFFIIGFIYFVNLITKKKLKVILNFAVCLTIIINFLWSIAFINIYRHENTRITASKWIYENIPEESTLLIESFDEGLPLNINNNPTHYNFENAVMYTDDTPSKILNLTQQLDKSDYIVFSSERFYKTVGKADREYPYSAKYYKMLFTEEMGFIEVVHFKMTPEILGVKIDDSSTEETFRVFDHPEIYIFKNEHKYNFSQIYEYLVGDVV